MTTTLSEKKHQDNKLGKMQMFKLLSFFISPRTSVNVTERGILHSHISVSRLFQEMFKFATLQIIGAKSVIVTKIWKIFHTTVT